MTGNTSTAVGCAVGIPVGLGLIVAGAFWLHMQRRLKREDLEDVQLEQEVHEDTEFDAFNHLHILQQRKKSIDNNSASEPSREGSQLSNDGEDNEKNYDSNATPYRHKKNSKSFVPAYRKKLNIFIQEGELKEDSTEELNGSKNIKRNQIPYTDPKNVSTYDQMVPIMPDGVANIFGEDSEDNNSQLTNSSKMLARAQYSDFRKNLYSQDFGSYYPRRTSTSDLPSFNNPYNHPNQSGSSLRTRSSSTNSISKHGIIENVLESSSRDFTQSSISLENNAASPTRDEERMLGKYKRKSHLNHDSSENETSNEILEEDYYENEFTNYSENKRQFIEGLKPTKNKK
ncbi:hypothetical protein TBLA_0E01800 [Henningerozyma blattae CBS 6284]|uniref:Suppressor of lethality of KEX2 GAS1 double null mutant protein 1 n=1 Tax=Henningerozyma blattae (strain ATCC 34711 / CBS 6284 / DSM 70876 / NBRC 10599 / NRRL Y-10934 / UCD 77-7) TaxID=1071380 RepID=I2H4D3_HENB6|nr:hypothetical protein TBLA_0E01800 [Tetrapisispora blattae CBS 6284]CCH61235.1 hypothetical protein TBLA_0E01800 [Tetrapisispora blattae CBS 6284]